jgi:hypothetical protein
MDECYEVARVLGYASLDEMLDGPLWQRVRQAEQGVVRAYRDSALRVREDVTEALLVLRDVVNDAEVADWMDTNVPMWRDQVAEGLQAEIRWAYTDVNLLWQELYRRVPEIFGVEGEQS